MTTIAIDLTTSLQSLSSLGRGRQYCWSGCTADFRAQIEVADSTSATTTVVVATPAGPSGVIPLPGDASVAGKFTLLTGSKTELWVTGDDAGSLVLDLTTSFQDVSGFTEGREVFLGGAPKGLVVAIEVASSTGASTYVEVARLNPQTQSYQLPNDSSVAMRYRVVAGAIGPNTKVWVCSAESGGAGQSEALAYLTIAALEAAPGPVEVSFAQVDQYESTYLFEPGATDAIDHLSVLGNTGGTDGRWFLQGQVVTFPPSGSDDSTAYQTLVNLVGNTGVGIQLKGGTYNFATTVSYPSGTTKGLRIYGTAATIVLGTISGTYPLTGSIWRCGLTGVAVATTTIAVSGATAGSDLVTATTITGIVKGMYVVLQSNVTKRRYTYLVENVTGSVMKLDRPIPLSNSFAAADTIAAYNASQVPQEIHIYGNGMQVQGTAVITFSLQTAVRSTIHDVRFDASTATAPSNAYGAFNSGCYDCHTFDVSIDGFDQTTGLPAGAPSVAWAFESADSCSFNRTTVRQGAAYGMAFLESYLCKINHPNVSGCTFGIVYGNDIIATIGSDYCEVNGGNVVNCVHSGVIVYDASLFATLNGVNASANGEFGFEIGDGTHASTDTTLIGCIGNQNTLSGVKIAAATKRTFITGCTFSMNVDASVLANDEVEIVNSHTVSATGAANGVWKLVHATADFLISNCTIEHLSTATGAIGVILQTGGQLRMSNTLITLGHASDLGLWMSTSAVVAFVSGVHVALSGAPETTLGFFNQTGAIRLGLGNDASATATPFSTSGGVLSQGLVTLNGATPVAVSFPDLKSTDRVRLTLNTKAGAAGTGLNPVVAYTPATGFSVVSVVNDTSIWEWSILS